LRRKRLTAQVGAPHQSPARPTPFRTIGEAPPQSEPSTAIPTNQVSRPQTRATDNSPQAACSACFRCAGSSRRRADLVAAGDELQSSAPAPNSPPLCAPIRATLASTDPTPAMKQRRPGAHSDNAHEPRHHARRVLRHACRSTPPDRRGAAGCFGRNPSCDVPNNRAVTIPAAPAVDYMAWAAATGSADLGAANHDPLPSRGCFGPFVATTRRLSPQPRGRRPADRERAGSRFRGTVAVTAPTG
jgi:hypothetical protein